MPKTIIGLSGYKGVGKTTAAVQLMKIGYTRIRFAQGLKSMLAALGLTEAQLDGNFKETPSPLLDGKTPRYAMQTLGAEWGRDMISPNLWTNDWKRRVKETPDHIPIVVDDLRYPNEQLALREFGGTILMIERDGCVPTNHSSEDLGHIDPDRRLINNGRVEDFLAEIWRLGFNLKQENRQ